MDYLTLLKEINYLSYFGALIKWMLLFLFISLIILFIGYKLKFFKRRNKIANILVKLYYVAIPVYFLIFAIKLSPVINTHKELVRIIENKKDYIIDFTYDFFAELVSDSLQFEELSAKEIINSRINQYLNKVHTSDTTKNKVGGKILRKVKTNIEFNFLKRVVEKKLLRKISGKTGLNTKTGKKLYVSSFKSLFQKGELIEIMIDQINQVFKGIYKSILLIFLLGLILPILEITLSRILKY